jgi:hypothetical protein
MTQPQRGTQEELMDGALMTATSKLQHQRTLMELGVRVASAAVLAAFRSTALIQAQAQALVSYWH